MALLCALWSLAAAWLAPVAFGASSVYWGNANGTSGAIRLGNLDGSGSPASLFSPENSPFGVALDSAAGKIYWTTFDFGSIRAGNLDGTGAQNLFTGETRPYDVVTDPAAGKIYWSDRGSTANSGLIRVGNLDGTEAKTLFSGEDFPGGLAIDPAAGKIYWTEELEGKIRVGNLDGTGARDLFTLENGPNGVAIDPVVGKIYWSISASGSGSIRVGNLDGTGARDLFTGEVGPNGLAIDAAAGKIYWADAGPGSVRVGNLDGTGAQDLFTGESIPRFVSLLRSPLAATIPAISGGSGTGSVLSCSQGTWADDLLGAFLYRAPESFAYQWSFNGTDIPGATSSSYTAPAPGSYTCRVTAANHAGSSAQTSAAHAVIAPLPPPLPTLTAPSLSSLTLAPTAFFAASSGSSIARVRYGTTVSYRDSQAAAAAFTVLQAQPGVKRGRRCVAPSRNKSMRKLKRCQRTVALGRFSHGDVAGADSFHFTGRVGGRALNPGRFTLRATASIAGISSKPVQANFRIKQKQRH
jgi:hypothetical protein